MQKGSRQNHAKSTKPTQKKENTHLEALPDCAIYDHRSLSKFQTHLRFEAKDSGISPQLAGAHQMLV